MDLDDAEENLRRFKEKYPDVPVYEATTLIAEGLDQVLYKAADLLEVTPEFPLFDATNDDAQGVLYKFEEEKPKFSIKNHGNGVWEVVGEEVELAYHLSKVETNEGAQRFARKLRMLGVDQALRDAGCVDGDTIVICDIEFDFVD